jgi:hypothetical protein
VPLEGLSKLFRLESFCSTYEGLHGRSLVGEGTDPITIGYGVGGFLETRVGWFGPDEKCVSGLGNG